MEQKPSAAGGAAADQQQATARPPMTYLCAGLFIRIGRTNLTRWQQNVVPKMLLSHAIRLCVANVVIVSCTRSVQSAVCVAVNVVHHVTCSHPIRGAMTAKRFLLSLFLSLLASLLFSLHFHVVMLRRMEVVCRVILREVRTLRNCDERFCLLRR